MEKTRTSLGLDSPTISSKQPALSRSPQTSSCQSVKCAVSRAWLRKYVYQEETIVMLSFFNGVQVISPPKSFLGQSCICPCLLTCSPPKFSASPKANCRAMELPSTSTRRLLKHDRIWLTLSGETLHFFWVLKGTCVGIPFVHLMTTGNVAPAQCRALPVDSTIAGLWSPL